MIIRAKYTKTDAMVYLSHLDMVRLFERAFRRAAIPVSYTQGFNPHPVLSFAAPISLGVESISEYMDVGVVEPIDPSAFVQMMNDVLPTGIRILHAHLIEEGTPPSLMKAVSLMEYHVTMQWKRSPDRSHLEQSIFLFLNREKILVQKKTKKNKKKGSRAHSFKEIDLLPFINEMNLLSIEGTNIVIQLFLHVKNQETVKPSLVMNQWICSYGFEEELMETRYRRTGIYRLNTELQYVPMFSKPEEKTEKA